jgi:hypothetical protein
MAFLLAQHDGYVYRTLNMKLGKTPPQRTITCCVDAVQSEGAFGELKLTGTGRNARVPRFVDANAYSIVES